MCFIQFNLQAPLPLIDTTFLCPRLILAAQRAESQQRLNVNRTWPGRSSILITVLDSRLLFSLAIRLGGISTLACLLLKNTRLVIEEFAAIK